MKRYKKLFNEAVFIPGGPDNILNAPRNNRLVEHNPDDYQILDNEDIGLSGGGDKLSDEELDRAAEHFEHREKEIMSELGLLFLAGHKTKEEFLNKTKEMIKNIIPG